MKRITIMGTIVIVFMFSFIGCSRLKSGENRTDNGDIAEEGGVSGTIVVATGRTDIVDTALKKLAQEFMEEYPGTTVKFEAFKDYDTVLATRVAGGEEPDIYYVISSMNQKTYAQYFLPIDDLGFDDDKVSFYSYGKGSDGKVYTINDSVSYTGIVYNKAAFRAAGIDKTPADIDEFYQVCARLKQAGITPVGTALKDVWPIYPWTAWDTVQATLRGDTRGKNVYLSKDEIFDDAMLESMNIIRTLYRNGYLEEDIMSASWEQFKLDIASGKVAMFYTESWFPSQMVELGAKEEDVGMFPFPGAKGILAVTGKSWGVSKNSGNPELAKVFLKYMIENGRYALACGSVPSYKTVKSADQAVAELMSYGVEVIETDAIEAEFTIMVNEIELDEQAFLQAYMMEEDDERAQAVVDTWNQKWRKVKITHLE